MSDSAGTMTAEKIAGEFKRQEDSFRDWVTDDGSSDYPAAAGRGWAFTDESDPVNGFQFLSEVYRSSDPQYRARVTVPVLFDKQSNRIVNNSEVDIVRMFNSAFGEWANGAVDLYPEPLRAEIDELDDLVYPHINNGVYRSGFAETQAAYEAGVVICAGIR